MSTAEKKMNQRLIQAYQQTPWRRQLQRIAYFMLALVLVALVAGLYLSVTAQTAAAGIEIQNMEDMREQLLRSNADLKSQLAQLTTVENMTSRAQEMGFEPVNQDEVIYMVISEYMGRPAASFAPASSTTQLLPRAIIRPSYTQSLWEWLLDEMSDLNSKNGRQG